MKKTKQKKVKSRSKQVCPEVIHVRITREQKSLLQEIAKRDKLNLADLIRGFLNYSEKYYKTHFEISPQFNEVQVIEKKPNV